MEINQRENENKNSPLSSDQERDLRNKESDSFLA
jgi:hypothetical protein